MGLFEIQRQLAAESGATTVRAEAASADHDRTGLAGFLADAWLHVRDPRYVARLYSARARTDPATALALARATQKQPAALRALAVEQRTLVAPLFTSRLFTDDPYVPAEQLITLGDPQSVAPAQALLATTDDEDLRLAIADVIATWADDKTCAALAVPPGYSPLAATLARRGHPAAQAALVTALRNFLNEWHRSGDGEWTGAYALVTAIGAARIHEAVPLLLASLVTPLICHALHALAELAPPKAREPARNALRELGGTQPERQWAYRLAAEHCLSALGEPQPPDTAREVLASVYPRRYGYPKMHEAMQLRFEALAALLDRGNDDDREQVARHLTAPYHDLRQLAAAATIKLGREVPPLRYLDDPRCREILSSDGPPALIAALSDPHVVYKDIVAAVLAAQKDAQARDAALTWALAHLGSTYNHPVSYLESSDLDVTDHAALEVVWTLRNDPALKPRIAASTSAWVREKLFKEKPEPTPPPALTGPWRARVRRLDRAPFVFGQQILGLALDPTSKRLAVVGENLGQIVDAVTGDLLVSLVLEYSFAFDCAFSPDGTALAVAYHGCHVVIFDAATGKRLRTIEGLGGVPDATKRLAFAPNGEHLAFAGSDGSAQLVLWRTGETVWSTRPRVGSFEAVHFDADGTCLFSHVKTKGGEENYLLRLRPGSRSATRIAMTSSMWCLARVGERWYAGGEGKKIRPLAATLAPARTGALEQAEVIRLAPLGDALLAVSQTGLLQRWDLATGKPTTLFTSNAKLWTLAVAADGTTYIAGTEGIVHRFTANGQQLLNTGGEVHTEHVTGIVPLANGDTLTTGWDGRLLRWSPEFGMAEQLLRHDRRLTCLAVQDDSAYAGADERLFVVDLATRETRKLSLRNRVEDLIVTPETIHLVTTRGHLLSFATADLSPRGDVALGGDATALARTGDGTLLVGTEDGALLEVDDGQISWSRSEFGRDLIDKAPHGNPHRTVVGLSVHAGRFVAAAGDDTLRVFDHAGHRRTLRLMTDCGLFNNCEFSPDGRTVGVTASGLTVFDANTGALLVHIPVRSFPGADELTIFTFTSPRRALAGACNGGLFEVTLEAP